MVFIYLFVCLLLSIRLCFVSGAVNVLLMSENIPLKVPAVLGSKQKILHL